LEVSDLETVVLVDRHDRVLGSAPKLEAHRRALRHRAFSIFIRDPAGLILLQRRARTKYHSGGLWANACCGHPREGEPNQDAAHRRLWEEMRLTADLRPIGKMAYQAELPDGWYENEVVHLFCGLSDAAPAPDPAEVEDWCWMAPNRLLERIEARPDDFAAWFRIYLSRMPSLLA
jgi:isopentenyl-diphosphate delta-isomerase